MPKQDKNRKQSEKNLGPSQVGELAKQGERQKAEAQEGAGRHKNDGQKGHKGRR